MSSDRYHRKTDGPCHHYAVYMLSCEEFDELYEYARGCCQLCGTAEAETPRGMLVIDHLSDYGFQAVRGLLCDKCNSFMARVDSAKVRGWVEDVARYRLNAWFARKVHPRLGARNYILTSRSDSARSASWEDAIPGVRGALTQEDRDEAARLIEGAKK